ncbi:MAG: hypothetical protein E7015_03120 [Alphaproteobacteria bacterium]|nr:hypothetical protein [Alphaproteobacteria bacterium]
MTIEKIVLDSVNQIKDGIIEDMAHKASKLPKCSGEIKPSSFHETHQNQPENINVINAFNRNKRLTIMVIGAAMGLIACLLVLTTYKNDLPGEIVGIVSTISGIFGACLKDAYSSEFGSFDKKDVRSSVIDKFKD